MTLKYKRFDSGELFQNLSHQNLSHVFAWSSSSIIRSSYVWFIFPTEVSLAKVFLFKLILVLVINDCGLILWKGFARLESFWAHLPYGQYAIPNKSKQQNRIVVYGHVRFDFKSNKQV